MNRLQDSLRNFSFSPATRAVFSTALLLAGAAVCVPMLLLPMDNPDVYWHLSAARWIAANGRLPTADFLSWTLGGQPWTDFEWLTQMLYYGLHEAGGFRALVFFKTAVIAGGFWFFAALLRLYGLGGVLFAAIPVLAAGLAPNLDVRPDNVTLTFFMAELYFLEKFRLRGFPGSRVRLLASTAFFFAVWANLHAGFAYGLLLLGMYAAGEIVQAALPAVYGRGAMLPTGRALAYAACAAAGAAGTLFNAYGWNIYAVLLQHMEFMAQMQQSIMEWQPSSVYNESQITYWAISGVTFTLMLYRQLRHKDLPFQHLFMVMYFALSSSSHVRHSPFMIIAGLAVSASVLSLEKWEGLKRWTAGAAAAAAFYFAAGLLLPGPGWWQFKHGWAGPLPPVGAVDFLRTHKAELSGLKLLNPWGWGGYIGYELYPDYKVSFDGRYIFHPLLNDAVGAHSERRDWDKSFRRHGWDLVITETPKDYYYIVRPNSEKEKKVSRIAPIYLEVMPAADWAMVYWDAQALVFVRRASADPRWLKEREYRLLKSGELDRLAARLQAGEVRHEEIRREVLRYLKGPDRQGHYYRRLEVGHWYKHLPAAPSSQKTHIKTTRTAAGM